MNIVSVNLHSYYNNFVNLHIFCLTDVSDFGIECVKLIYFSILHWLMQMFQGEGIWGKYIWPLHTLAMVTPQVWVFVRSGAVAGKG